MKMKKMNKKKKFKKNIIKNYMKNQAIIMLIIINLSLGENEVCQLNNC